MEVNNYYLHQPLDTLTIEKGDHQQQTLRLPTVSSNTILLQKKKSLSSRSQKSCSHYKIGWWILIIWKHNTQQMGHETAQDNSPGK